MQLLSGWRTRLPFLLIEGGVLLFITAVVLLIQQRNSAGTSGCTPAGGDWLPALLPLVGSDTAPQPCRQFNWGSVSDDEFHNLIQLDNYGFHDAPLELSKPLGVYRILLLGDSFPQGIQVPPEQGFPALLETFLSARLARKVEVVNASVSAYSTDRELFIYTILGWRFQPDMVLLSVYVGNDIEENDRELVSLDYGGQANRAFFTLEQGVLRLHNSPVYPATRFPDSPAYQWLISAQEQQSPMPPVDQPLHPQVISTSPYELEYPVALGLYLSEDRYWSQAWALTEALIVQLADLVHQQGSQFAIVVIPDRRAVHPEDWQATIADYAAVSDLSNTDPAAPERRLDEFLTAQHIPALDLTSALQFTAKVNGGQRLYYPRDGHFNAAGHAAAAEAIGNWLLDSALVPAS
jgi:lysophospholipase L1-like esterase